MNSPQPGAPGAPPNNRPRAGELMGATVRSADGDKLGTIGHIFFDERSDQPEWVTVRTGLFGTRESFLPLVQIQLDGTEARVPYDTETIISAPNVDIDGTALSARDEAELYRYFVLTYGPAAEVGAVTGFPARRRLRRYVAGPVQATSRSSGACWSPLPARPEPPVHSEVRP